jgi:hypothetical protein
VGVLETLDALLAEAVEADRVLGAVVVDLAGDRRAVTTTGARIADALVVHALHLSVAVRVLGASTHVGAALVEADVALRAVAVDLAIHRRKTLPIHTVLAWRARWITVAAVTPVAAAVVVAVAIAIAVAVAVAVAVATIVTIGRGAGSVDAELLGATVRVRDAIPRTRGTHALVGFRTAAGHAHQQAQQGAQTQATTNKRVHYWP